MQEIFKQVPLYRFLAFSNELNLDKTVLDCGAGGDCPPLSLFAEYGYITKGIEFDAGQLTKAKAYEAKHGQNLNIQQGDMRKLAFCDQSFSFVYSYNSIFHMTKKDVEKSVNELKRVLKKDGLLFANFLTTKDHRCGEGIAIGENQYEQMDDYAPVIHSYFEESEPDKYFEGMEVLYKECRVLERIYEGRKIKQGFVDYIVKKV